MTVALLDVHAAVLNHLRATMGGVTVHDGTVTAPTVDAKGRVQPYLVVWVAPGTDPEPAVTGRVGAEHRIYVTAAAGTPAACAWAVDKATAALSDLHYTETVDVTFQWLPGYDPGPIREDRDVNPSRWFVPLIFTALAV